MGVRPNSSSLSSATTRHTEAASFWLLAFPAVTQPSCITGRRRPSTSIVVSARGPSSVSKDFGIAATLGNADGHNFGIELCRRRGRPRRVGGCAGQTRPAPAAGFRTAAPGFPPFRPCRRVWGRNALRGRNGNAGASQAVVEGNRAETGRPSGIRCCKTRRRSCSPHHRR